MNKSAKTIEIKVERTIPAPTLTLLSADPTRIKSNRAADCNWGLSSSNGVKPSSWPHRAGELANGEADAPCLISAT